MPKITVYSCSYNAEKYIDECIQSVLNQTFQDFEYIIHDNGSTDKTKEIIRQYAKNDSRIKFVDIYGNPAVPFVKYLKEYATGEYLVIVDGDDYIDNTFLEEMYTRMLKSKLDMIICGTSAFKDDGARGILRVPNKDRIIEASNFSDNFGDIYQFIRTVWGKMMKMSLVKETDIGHQIQNLNYGGYGSDTAFMLAYLEKCNKIELYDKVLHNYRMHGSSISYMLQPNRIYTKDVLYTQSLEFLKKYGNISSYNIHFINIVYFYSIVDEVKIVLNCDLNDKEKIKLTNNIFNQKNSRHILKYLILLNEKLEFSQNVKDVYRVIIDGILSCLSKINIKDDIENYLLLLTNINYNFDILINRNNLNEYISEKEFVRNNIYSTREKIIYNALKITKDKFIYKDILDYVNDEVNNNILIKDICDEDFICQYSEIINYILENNIEKSIDKIVGILEGINVIYEDKLIKVLINLSASINDSNTFIYSKKLLTKYYILSNNMILAKELINELTEMIPDDKDLLLFKNCIS